MIKIGVVGVAGGWSSELVADEVQKQTGFRLLIGTGDLRYAQDIRIGHHVVRADEPVAVGGQDTGPTPHELLLAALGACTAITMRMYADRKQWPVKNISVKTTTSAPMAAALSTMDAACRMF